MVCAKLITWGQCSLAFILVNRDQFRNVSRVGVNIDSFLLQRASEAKSRLPCSDYLAASRASSYASAASLSGLFIVSTAA